MLRVFWKCEKLKVADAEQEEEEEDWKRVKKKELSGGERRLVGGGSPALVQPVPQSHLLY